LARKEADLMSLSLLTVEEAFDAYGALLQTLIHRD
jgi:hypothetical protein